MSIAAPEKKPTPSQVPDRLASLIAPMEGEAPATAGAKAPRRPLGQQLIGANLLKPTATSRWARRCWKWGR